MGLWTTGPCPLLSTESPPENLNPQPIVKLYSLTARNLSLSLSVYVSLSLSIYIYIYIDIYIYIYIYIHLCI